MINRRTILKAFAFGAATQAGGSLAAPAQSARANVLLITVDDLNCSISPYAPAQEVHSPNFERLRSWGAMFESAYAAVPVCSGSRTAMLLGMDPMRTEIFVNAQSWLDAKTPPGAVSLFGHFRSQGWTVGGTGKLFHRSIGEERASDWDDYWQPYNYPTARLWHRISLKLHRLRVGDTDIAASKDGAFDFGPNEIGGRPDLLSTGWILNQLQAGAFDGGGGFLALGLSRPHLPHSVPQEWFDRYPERVALPLGYWPGATDLDGNLPDQEDLGPTARRSIDPKVGDRLTQNNELNAYLRAYYASTSFADGQIGRVLDTLEAQGVRENTYIVVTSDHGFMLGEKRDFGKVELREVALRIPLFISGPGIAPCVVRTPVSLVDLYPTLCGLAGVEVPTQCDGRNLAPALLSGQQPEREPVFSYFGSLHRESGRLRLHSSVRTAQWRLICYDREEVELYDHDPESPTYDPHEWFNLASKHPGVVKMLRQLLPTTTYIDLVLSEVMDETSQER